MNQGRWIVNTSSLAGHSGGNGTVPYAASKAEVIGLTRGLAKELAPRNITVNALAPGFIIDTPFHKTFTDKEQYEGIISGIPLQQAEVPDDVAGTVLHFVSGLGKWVTGQVTEINGGAWVCIEAMDVIMTKTDLQMPRQSRPACKYTRSHLASPHAPFTSCSLPRLTTK